MRWQVAVTKMIAMMLRPYVREVHDIQRVPLDRPYVMVSNHFSHLDSFIIVPQVMAYSNRILHCFGDRKAWWEDSRFLRWFAIHNEAIPVDRENPSDEPLIIAKGYIERGDGIILYPEGTRNTGASMRKAKTGFTRLALECRAPIVPVGITGTLEIQPRWKRYPDWKKFKRVVVRYGEPLETAPYFDRCNDPALVRALTDDVMERIAFLAGLTYDRGDEAMTAR